MTTTSINSSSRLFEIVEDDSMFEPIRSVNQQAGKYMLFDTHEDTDDGTFPRVSDYTRLINRMDKDGTSEFLTWISSKESKKLISDVGYCKVVRKSKYDNKATLLFKEPIKIIVEYINEEPITIEVNCIEGEFTHEWFWTKHGRQNTYANGFNIYFDCQKYKLEV